MSEDERAELETLRAMQARLYRWIQAIQDRARTGDEFESRLAATVAKNVKEVMEA